MSPRRELAAFGLVLGGVVVGFLHESLLGGKVLSPADVLFVSASFREVKGPGYEPANRLLIDPVLQFQPWLELNRALLRRGRLPLWNDQAGCGAPLLANGQSAPFDPFHLIAYVGTLPRALAPMAAARLWFAGLGAFLLARAWGLGGWGRWFAGLAFPLSGFVVVWLLFPVTNAAVWTPWVFLATSRVLERPGVRRVGGLGLAVGGLFLGGHVQTSAHALLAAGLFAGWWLARRRGGPVGRTRPLVAWSAGVALGLTVAAVSIVPLGVYLGKSPVWGDRARERPSPWRLTPPRLLDGLCTAVPDLFGSQRRGQPNLARALGVHNYNESGGGFAGLATLLWLAPQALRARRRNPYVGFLAGLTLLGFLGAFGVAPVINVVRAVPVLNVTDARRLTLWVAFGLCLLGGVGLDGLSLAWPERVGRWWLSLGLAASLVCVLGALLVPRAEPWLRARAEAHYAAAADRPDSDSAAARRHADRQVRATLGHVPRVLVRTALEVAAVMALAVLAHRRRIGWRPTRLAALCLTLAGMFHLGFGLNPALAARDDRPVPPVIAYLRGHVGASGRVLGLGQELVPNVAQRYGLADPRNYDSVELSRSLDWFEPLYEPDERGRSSRRTITWAGVARARDRLREGSVAAVVSATPPPEGLGLAAERVGGVWVARLAHEPLASAEPSGCPLRAEVDHGRIAVSAACPGEGLIVVRQTYDHTWRAELDGRPAPVVAYRGAFLAVKAGAGVHRVTFRYDPPEVRVACAASVAGLLVACVAVTGLAPGPMPRFRGRGLGRSRGAGLESVP